MTVTSPAPSRSNTGLRPASVRVEPLYPVRFPDDPT